MRELYLIIVNRKLDTYIGYTGKLQVLSHHC